MPSMKSLLDGGQIASLVARLREIAAEQTGLAEEILKEADFFATNASRMNYPEFRAKGLFVGTGVVEAGCKTVIGVRLKRSGMFWTVRGANAIAALRCCRLNGRFEDYWEEAQTATCKNSRAVVTCITTAQRALCLEHRRNGLPAATLPVPTRVVKAVRKWIKSSSNSAQKRLYALARHDPCLLSFSRVF